MVNCIDNDGNPVRLGQGQPTQQGHTPGPWIIGASDADIDDWSVDEDIISADGRWIAGALTVGAKRQEQRVSLVECQANAALIAAAPWHALLLRAVLKGWAIEYGENDVVLIHHKFAVVFHFTIGASGLPACPDAETYERIRKAVDGD